MELQGRTNPTVQEIEEGAAQGAKLNLYDNIQEFIHNFETTYDQKKLKESKKSTPRSTRKAKSSSIKNYLTPLF
jgi:flagellar biosynthesis chaperone FliJ